MADHPSISGIRKVYHKFQLNEADALPDPIRQFEKWWNDALASNPDEVNAMTIATCDKQGNPSARTVLLKAIHDDGFVFYTNYESRKGKELIANPSVALLFFWRELERQVRVEGRASKISPEESDAYFITRPVESRLGAWTSPQSQVIPGRDFLENREKEIESKFSGKEIPRPDFWGGFIVVPKRIEFWQGRPGRLHDRLLYSKENGLWKIERLAP